MNTLASLPLFTHDGSWDHHWWPVFPLFWITLIALLWFFVWRRRWRRDPLDSARQILAERYARDEIGAEEYRKRLDELGRGG
jgi:putative membrane protein